MAPAQGEEGQEHQGQERQGTANNECQPSELLRQFVGQTFTPEIEARAQAISGAAMVRLLRPGIAVTTEQRSNRLNIQMDEAGVIVSLRCG